MNADYTQAMLMSDITNIVVTNAPAVVGAAILLASFNFIIGWFMHSMHLFYKAPFQD